ncbi:MAG: DUF1080 domain-containing protein [Verrucomicrobiota bacterium]
MIEQLRFPTVSFSISLLIVTAGCQSTDESASQPPVEAAPIAVAPTEANQTEEVLIEATRDEIAPIEAPLEEGFVRIFNGENFDGWYLKLRNDDEELAKRIFAIEDGMIHVFNDSFPDEYELNTGGNETHGLIYTEKVYSKYILRFDYKWGSRIANNFDDWQYDAGLYYHVIDDKIWPVGIEYQIRYDHTTGRNHTGDFIRPKGTRFVWHATEDGSHYLHPDDGGKRYKKKSWQLYAKPTENFNALNGEWNECEVIVMGDEYAIHKLNGEVVNMAVKLKPDAGIFGFQSETAEIFYRNIRIKELEESIPAEEFLD